VTGFNGGITPSVGLSCGHTLYGEFALRARLGSRVVCPMCAGCGPRFYVAVGRARKPYAWTYELRERTPHGRPPVLGWSGSETWIQRRAAELNGSLAAHGAAA